MVNVLSKHNPNTFSNIKRRLRMTLFSLLHFVTFFSRTRPRTISQTQKVVRTRDVRTDNWLSLCHQCNSYASQTKHVSHGRQLTPDVISLGLLFVSVGRHLTSIVDASTPDVLMCEQRRHFHVIDIRFSQL